MEIERKESNLVWIIRRSFSEGETTVSYVTAVIVLSKKSRDIDQTSADPGNETRDVRSKSCLTLTKTINARSNRVNGSLSADSEKPINQRGCLIFSRKIHAVSGYFSGKERRWLELRSRED